MNKKSALSVVSALLVFSLAVSARALEGVADPVEVPGADTYNPAAGIDWYESQYGMTTDQRARLNNVGYSRVYLPGVPANTAAPSDLPSDSLGSQAPAAPAQQDDAAASPGPILEATGHGLESHRDLLDAPGPIPLPARDLAGSFGVPGPAPRPALSGFAPERSARKGLLDNLNQAPLFTPRQMNGFTPESANAALDADYGARVLDQGTRAPAPVQDSASAPGAAAAAGAPGQAPPLAVLVELRLAPSQDAAPAGSAPGAAASPLQSGVRELVQQGLIVDRSFPLLIASADRRSAFVRGWMDSDKLMTLALDPNVARVTVVGNSGAAGQPTLEVPVSLRLRLRRGEGLAAFLRRTLPALEEQAGFEWRVSNGWQLQPSADGAAVMLTGELPSGAVGKLLAYPDLIRVEPFLAPAAAPAADAVAASAPAAPESTARRALNLACLSLAFPWMGILLREIFFWLRLALYGA